VNALRFLVVAISILACSCVKGPSSLAGGTASEGEAMVRGRVVDNVSGVAVINAAVRLRRADFLRDTAASPVHISTHSSADLATDSHGGFIIDSVDTGKYCIEVNDGDGKAVLFTCAILSRDTLVDLALDSVRPAATINGVIDSRTHEEAAVYVQMYGLERIAKRDPVSGGFSISDVPAGDYSLRILSSSPLFSPRILTIISVRPGVTNSLDTIDVAPFQGWNYSRKCVCNTTASGANVAGNVMNFPILIRLTNSNFNFSEANIDGGDLRFARSDSTPLPYEIERWDEAQGAAEVWVKLDTVYGNDSVHYVSMIWGNANAASASNGASVFDTANGFQGVWHLGQAGNAVAHDATYNHFDQTPFGMTAASSVSGVIGGAQRFDGMTGFFEAAGTASGKLDFPRNGTYAISAWVYADTMDQYDHTIACKGDYQYNLEIIPSDEWEFAEYGDGAGWDLTTSHATGKVWTHVTGVRDGAGEYLYVNGTLADSIITAGPSTVARNTGFDFMIGRTMKSSSDTTAYFFKGIIDEVRITSVAPGADWVKLCYMNQKASDQLVEFR
jgi:Concanavalin A-like lectin/glucanases superfamily/Domain of unknown function (DUF2341)